MFDRKSKESEENLGMAKECLEEKDYIKAQKYAMMSWKIKPNYEAIETALAASLERAKQRDYTEDYTNAENMMEMAAENLPRKERDKISDLKGIFYEALPQLREKVRQVLDLAMTGVLELAEIRLKYDDQEKVGALYDAAIVALNLFESTGNPSYFIKGCNYINNAYSQANDEEKEWVGKVRDWSRNPDIEILRKSVRESMDNPDEETFDLARTRIALDKNEKVGALYDAAITSFNLAEKSKRGTKRYYLGEGQSFINRALEIASDQEKEWVTPIKQWGQTIKEQYEARPRFKNLFGLIKK